MEKLEGTDLLTAILINLPPKSVFRFMCVSNRWNNLMKDPLFLQSYNTTAKRRKEAFVTERLQAFIEIKRNGARFHGLSPSNSASHDEINYYKFDKVPQNMGYFIGCSDGLILCGRRHQGYYILNPIRGTRVPLPPQPIGHEYPFYMGLVCQENTAELVPNFMVLAGSCINNEITTNTMPILTYSSKTGKWASSTLMATKKFRLHDLKPPVVVNGIFHWFLQMATLAVYNSNRCDNYIQLINLPCDSVKHPSTVTRSSSDDVLWFVSNKKKSLEFWMLPKDQQGRSTIIPKTEWILKHRITHDFLREKIIRYMYLVERTVENDFIKSCRVKLECLIPRKPLVAVLKLEGIICFYDLEAEFVELVQHGGAREGTLLYPYMEPVSLASCALRSS